VHPCNAGILRASPGNPVTDACGHLWPLVNRQTLGRVAHAPCPKLSRLCPSSARILVLPMLLGLCPNRLRTCRRKKNRPQHPRQPCQRISNLLTTQSPPAIPLALCRISADGGANPTRTHHNRPSALTPGTTTAHLQRHPSHPLPNPQGNQPGATGETQTAHVGGYHHNASIKSGNAPEMVWFSFGTGRVVLGCVVSWSRVRARDGMKKI